MSNGMQFIEDGPVIPNELRQSHAKGELILFCGAGISYQLGLKDFEGLTKDLYKKLNVDELLKTDEVREEFCKKNYDRVLGFLEEKREAVFREELGNWGKIEREDPDYSTHQAIIDLSTTEKHGCRLVTTNFDLGFYNISEKEEQKIKIDSVPKFPIPKEFKWNNSIVHLHGIATDPENIVITSADFGSAYITERWASRFVTDLFSTFDILFVGYSLNDPVLRYLTDAIASDEKKRSSNEKKEFLNKKRFALVPKGESRSWKAKNVIPIEYVVKENDDHTLLYDTLKNWTEKYKDGSLGFKKLCSNVYRNPPVKGNVDINYVVDELFNNSDISTKLFVRHEEVEGGIEKIKHPCFEWWEYLSKEEKAKPKDEKGKNAQNKLMSILVKKIFEKFDSLHNYHFYYINWFIDMMHLPELQLWVVSRDSILHPDLYEKIMSKYRDVNNGFTDEARMFWDYLLFKRDFMKIPDNFNSSLYPNNFNVRLHYVLDFINAQKISAFLKIYPRIYYSKPPYSFNFGIGQAFEEEEIFCIDYKLVDHDSSRYVYKYIKGCNEEDELKNIFLHLSSELQKVVDSELHWNNIKYDYDSLCGHMSFVLPLKDNHQNTWTYVIECLMICFFKLSQVNLKVAHILAMPYFLSKVPFLKRLSLYFLTNKKVFLIKDVISYLKINIDDVMWSHTYEEEWLWLLKNRWAKFDKETQSFVMKKILAGRKCYLYEKALNPKNVKTRREGAKAGLLNWFDEHQMLVDKTAKEELESFKLANPNYSFSEFRKRCSDEPLKIVVPDPVIHLYKIKKANILAKKLLDEMKERAKRITRMWTFDFSDWMASEYSNNLLNAMEIIVKGTSEEQNNMVHIFFRSISHKNEIIASNYKKLISLFRVCSKKTLQECIHNITICLRNIMEQKLIPLSEVIDIWNVLFEYSLKENIDNWKKQDCIQASINTSIGNLYKILFDDFFSVSREWDCGLNDYIKDAWKKLDAVDGFHKSLAYVHYGMHLSDLSIVDFDWFENKIYPALKRKDNYSYVLWNCYLYSPYNYSLRFIKLVKEELLDLSHQKSKVNYSDKYMMVLCYISLYDSKHLTPQEFRKAVFYDKNGDIDMGYQKFVVEYISRQISNTETSKKNEFWNKRIKPWIKEYWPRSNKFFDKQCNIWWFKCILELENPTKCDFDLIKSLLSPGVRHITPFLSNSQKFEKIASNPNFLPLINTMIKKANISLYEAREFARVIKQMSSKFDIKNSNDYVEIEKKLIELGVII